MNRQIKDILDAPPLNQTLTVNGWIRTRRDSGGLSFIEVNDGSCLRSLQVIAERGLPCFEEVVPQLTTGSAVSVQGRLSESPARGQEVELRAETIRLVGPADPKSYPLQKKRHSFEFLRGISHLRPRTNALGAVARVRAHLSLAIHRFFAEHGFFQVHTPIITTSDCEGAGEMFTVTALGPEQLRDANSFDRDFFGRRAGLTVSGQLQAEVYAQALGRVYTFGPTFRAENSNTSRHLAEFWMVEPEMAFSDLQDNRALAESLIRNVIGRALDGCGEDLELFDRFVRQGLIRDLEKIRDTPFTVMTYDEAVALLAKARPDRPFVHPVAWGMDLQSEHERFLCEEAVGGPLVIIHYPAEIKPFYMRLNEDGKTVAAMDVLVPGIGELVGGSQREERYPVLKKRMTKAGLDLEEYGWYLDLRRYGTTPHAGFGLGFERLVQLVTGMSNIRDVIPFPRTPGSAPC